MPTNIEVKAMIKIGKAEASKVALDLLKQSNLPKKLDTLKQVDTFYKCNNGRLKLRREQFNDQPEAATLIAYERPDIVGPKRSDYVKTCVQDPQAMNEILKRSCGVIEQVVKIRLLAIVEREGLKSRIHLDTVEGLGDYIEFEVMIEDEADLNRGEEFAKFLSQAFSIKDEDHVDGAYVDSILASQKA